MQPTIDFHTTRGVRVRVLRAGQGDPLVFLHGAGGMAPWGPFLEGLAASFEVIAPEHPGFGLSDTPDTIRNIADMAMYYLDFLKELGHAKVHLVGTSLGGWIAAEAAIRNTSNMRSLSLLAPAGLRVKGVPMGDNFIWSQEEGVRNLVHDQKIADAMLAVQPSEEEAERALKNRFMVAKLGWEPRWHDPALARWLHRIDAPTQVLWGREDKLFPAAYADAWATHLPGCSVEILPDAGHLLHIEKPADVASRIIAFAGGR